MKGYLKKVKDEGRWFDSVAIFSMWEGYKKEMYDVLSLFSEMHDLDYSNRQSTALTFMSLDKFEYLKNSAVKIQTASLPGVVTIKNDKEVFIKQNISASPALVQLKDLPEGRYVVEYESGNSRLSRVIFIADEASVKAFLASSHNRLLLANWYLANAEILSEKAYDDYAANLGRQLSGKQKKASLK